MKVRWLIAAMLVVMLAPVAGHARAGDLDPAFAGGLAYAGFPLGASAGGVDVEGSKTVVVGGGVSRRGLYDTAVARFTSTGKLDKRFSGDGRALVDMGGIEFATDVSIARDGSVYTAMLHIRFEDLFDSDCCTLSAAVSKLDERGRPVKAFGTKGVAPLALAGMDDFNEFILAIEAVEGGVVIAGYVIPIVGPPPPLPMLGTTQGFVAKLGEDGALDPTFGQGGVFYLPAGAPNGVIDMMALEDGSLVLAGWGSALTDGFVLSKLTPLGTLDPTFGPGGITTVDAGSPASAAAIAPGPGGTILVAGAHQSGQWVLTRHLADGTLDPGFGQRGVIKAVLGDISAPRAVGWAGGRLYVVAARRSCVYICINEGIIARLKVDGKADNRFGRKGIAQIGFAVIEPVGLAFHGTKPVIPATSLSTGGDIVLARLKS